MKIQRRTSILVLGLLTTTSLFISRVSDAMTIIGVEHASTTTESGSTLTVYGGVAGAPGDSPGNSGDVTNSCANLASRYAPCNERRVNQNTVLIIRTRTDQATTGTPRLFLVAGPSGTSPVAINLDPSSPEAAGTGDSFIAVKWGDVCAALSDGTLSSQCVHDGSTPLAGTFRVGYTTGIGDTNLPAVDTADFRIVVSGYMGVATALGDVFASDCGDSENNQYGLCAFRMRSGRRVAKLVNLHVDNGTDGPGLPLAGVRVLFAKTDKKTPDYSVVTGSSDHQDFKFTTDARGNLALSGRGVVRGLTSHQTYAFKTAMIDEAGNVGLYTANTVPGQPGKGDTFCPNGPRTMRCHAITVR